MKRHRVSSHAARRYDGACGAAPARRRVPGADAGLAGLARVTEGQELKVGEELAVIEAMKMENVLRAERNGKNPKPGDSLAADQVIPEFG